MEASDSQQFTAYFSDRATAQNAVDDLKAAGISSGDLALHDQSTGGGGFMDNLKRFFGAETDHSQYGTGTLLTIYGNREIAMPILRRYDAQLGSAAYDQAGDQTATQTMKLREERLTVDKQPVKAGEVRLGKEVITEEQNIDVPVAHEEVYVSRRPVTEGEYAGNVGEIGDDGEIVLPVMREEVAVNKEAVVTEEVGLNKRTVQETETVEDTIRKERPTIETHGDIDRQVIERNR